MLWEFVDLLWSLLFYSIFIFFTLFIFAYCHWNAGLWEHNWKTGLTSYTRLCIPLDVIFSLIVWRMDSFIVACIFFVVTLAVGRYAVKWGVLAYHKKTVSKLKRHKKSEEEEE